MKQLIQNITKQRMERAAAVAALAATFGMSGALFPAFAQGAAATFITWFRANLLESGWVAALAFVALFAGVIGMFIGEQRGMKVFTSILICVAAAFLGGDQIIALITARF
jgi:hypothetical protein